MTNPLSAFRADDDPQTEPHPAFSFEAPTTYISTLSGAIMAVDQSLSATGWVVMALDAARPKVVHHGTLLTVYVGDRGYADGMLTRGALLYESFMSLLLVHQPVLIIHETPPMGQTNMRTAESSTLSAMALRCAASANHIPVEMVHARHAKKVLTGDANATKQAVKAVVAQAVDGLPNRFPEAVADAVAVALTWAKDLTNKERNG